MKDQSLTIKVRKGVKVEIEEVEGPIATQGTTDRDVSVVAQGKLKIAIQRVPEGSIRIASGGGTMCD